MMNRTHLLVLTASLAGFLTHGLYAQQSASADLGTQRATTEKGRGVILKKNGKWEYAKVADGTASAKDLENDIRRTFEAWNANKVGEIVSTEALVGGVGFGYRTRAARLPGPTTPDRATAVASIKGFFDAFEYFRVTLDEVQTAVDGNIGMGWGFYTEEFKPKGGAVQVVKARFSGTWRREGNRWRQLLYHRDATSFDDKGRFVPATSP